MLYSGNQFWSVRITRQSFRVGGYFKVTIIKKKLQKKDPKAIWKKRIISHHLFFENPKRREAFCYCFVYF